MSITRPLPWISRGFNNVDVLSTLGHQVVQAAINHVSLAWGSSDIPDTTIHNALIPNEYVFDYLEFGSPLPCAPLTPVSLQFFLLEPSSRPVPLMKPHDLLSWWEKLINQSFDNFSNLTEELNRPVFLIQTGYKLLNEKYFEARDCSHELGACLSMIGAGAIALFASKPCNHCQLRRSMEGTMRCRTCSRSKLAINSNDSTTQAAQANRVRRIRISSNTLEMPLSRDLYSSYLKTIASLLFSLPMHCKAHLDWLSEVNSALDNSPKIKALVGADFSVSNFQSQTQMLRDSIDENEWDYGQWPDKILKAQSLQVAVEMIQQRRKGPGPMTRTIALSQRAHDLLKLGSSKKDIASALSISPSYLSHILRRTSQTS